MLHVVFSGGGGGGFPLNVVTSLITLMLLLMSEPIYGSATANLNLTLNMVLAHKQETPISFGSSVAFWRTGGSMNLVVGAPLTPYEHKNTSYPLGNIFLCTLKGICAPFHGLPSLYPKGKNQCVNRHRNCPSRATNWACENQQTTMMKDCPLECKACDKLALEFGKEYLQEMGMGLGETLSFTSSNGTSDTILLACAPRFPIHFKPRNLLNPEQFMSRGACFRMKDSNSVPDRILPFKDNFVRVANSKSVSKNNEQYTGFGMAGFSATLTKEDETVFMGNPNTYYGQGSLSSRKFTSGKPFEFNKKTFSTNQIEDYNREGWAVASGRFNSETGLEYIATSVPLADDSYGKIQFYSKSLKEIESRLSDDVSSTHGFKSYYGYALAVGDLDNDGNEDLIVGAPLAKGRKGAVEGGKVFVYYGPLNNKIGRKTQIIEGPTPWLRFGSAVVSDDFNRDGYYDIAVGAPYGAQGWGGAVYIYMGGREGLCEKTGGICDTPDQLICASDFNYSSTGSSGNSDLQYLHTFTSTSSKPCKKLSPVSSPSSLVSLGYSLATADVDKNGYPDLLIGAPKAEKAILIRSAPVVDLAGEIFFEPKEIPLGNKTCDVTNREDSEKTVCFLLKISIYYEAHKLGIRNLGVILKIELDHEVSKKRILFKWNNEAEHEWKVNIPETESESTNSTELEVYVKTGVVDFDKPITAKIKVQLQDNQYPTRSIREMDPVPPVLYKPKNVFETSGYLQCQDGSSCYSKPNVKMMKFKSMAIVVDGTSFKVHANISITEDYALGINLNITHPKMLTAQERASVKFNTILQDNSDRVKDAYKDVKIISETLYEIRIEERIKNNTKISVELVFGYEHEDLMMYLINNGTSNFEIDFSVATNSDTNLDDNKATLTVEAVTDLNLDVNSYLKNETYQVNAKSTWSLSQLKEASNNSEVSVSGDHLGPIIDFKIVILNKGPASMQKAEVFFDLPLWIPDFPLFYVTEGPTAEGAYMKCDLFKVNPGYFHFKNEDNYVEREPEQDTMAVSTDEEGNSYERRKRDADYKTSTTKASNGNTSLFDNFHSNEIDGSKKDANQIIRCDVGYLAPDKTVIITLKNSRISIPTLLKFQPDIKEYRVPVRARVVAHQPGKSKKETIVTTNTLITIVQEERVLGLKDLPWWYFLLAILGGILLILLFSYCLYKAGFFKRNRPPMASSGVKTDSATKIVEENEHEPDDIKFQEGFDNSVSESTPLNQRKEMDSDAAVV